MGKRLLADIQREEAQEGRQRHDAEELERPRSKAALLMGLPGHARNDPALDLGLPAGRRGSGRPGGLVSDDVARNQPGLRLKPELLAIAPHDPRDNHMAPATKLEIGAP